MRNLYFILSVFLFVQLALAANPIGNCQGGRAVPYTFAASGGACNIPRVTGIPVANVNEAFFNKGAKCGACYEVTGPTGSVVVQVVDLCPASTGTGTCAGDATQFALDESTAYNTIVANRNSTDIIYDLGFREVTCDVTGNVKYIAADATDYYFKLTVWNFRVAINEIRIKGNGWGEYNSLERQGTSGVWQWNKKSDNLKFPLTIYLVGTTNELITQTVKSFSSGVTADFGDQFTNVATSTQVCPMYSTPSATVYEDEVGYGWGDLKRNSFKYESIITADTTNPYSGTACLHAQLYNEGGVLFSRLGGFNPQYFSYITFAARANNNLLLKVYSGSGTSLFSSPTITSQWTVFNVSVSTLTTSELEYNLVFMNVNGGGLEDLWLDDIKWTVASTTPEDEITPVTTGGYEFVDTTTTGVVLVDTTGNTGGFSFGDSSDDTSSAVSVVSNALTVMIFTTVIVIVACFF